MSATPVNTKSAEHRKLRFETLEQMRAEAEKIAVGERAGTLRCTGNWTAGQTFNHLATWIEFGYDGFPSSLRPPWIVKLVIKLLKGRMLKVGLPKGVRIGKIPGGTLGIEQVSLEDGLRRLNAAIDRATKSAPTQPSPVFGAMSHQDFIRGTLRHAELHMGFLHP